MAGSTTTNQAQQQQSTTAPWAPAIPAVTGLLNNVAGNPTGNNTSQTGAVQQLENNAGSATNFGAPVAGAASNLINGGNPAYSGILSGGYGTLQNNLNPIANGSEVGKNSALTGQLSTIANDTQNAVESQFAAAGRGGPGAMSPAEAQAIARGTAQGEAPVLAGQYNQDISNQIGANQALESGALQTGTGLNSITSGNVGLGTNLASLYPGLLNANANSLLQAGNTEQALPYQGTGLAESQLLPIAGLGAQSSGTSNGTTTQQQPLGPTLLGGVLGATALLSDQRLKKDIKHVGVLNSGDNLYEFKYKNDPNAKKHVGVLAQEIEKRHPEDVVHDAQGIKHVNYAGVLARAA